MFVHLLLISFLSATQSGDEKAEGRYRLLMGDSGGPLETFPIRAGAPFREDGSGVHGYENDALHGALSVVKPVVGRTNSPSQGRA